MTPAGVAARALADVAIRPLQGADVGALKNVIEATDMFPPHMLDDMVAGYLSGTTSDRWLIVSAAVPIAVAFYAPEKLTEGTWNLLLIAVHPGHQGRGYGTALVECIECELTSIEQRLLIVETSGLAGFERTRGFYVRCGYSQEAVIRDFYQAGEDKVVFRKSLV